jgi:hypothetical protein
MSVALADLEAIRTKLLQQFLSLGDFRPGTVSAVPRRCGKPKCHCAQCPMSKVIGAWNFICRTVGMACRPRTCDIESVRFQVGALRWARPGVKRRE